MTPWYGENQIGRHSESSCAHVSCYGSWHSHRTRNVRHIRSHDANRAVDLRLRPTVAYSSSAVEFNNGVGDVHERGNGTTESLGVPSDNKLVSGGWINS